MRGLRQGDCGGDQVVMWGIGSASPGWASRANSRCLTTTNVIESPNSVVRGVSGRVTNYKELRRVAA